MNFEVERRLIIKEGIGEPVAKSQTLVKVESVDMGAIVIAIASASAAIVVGAGNYWTCTSRVGDDWRNGCSSPRIEWTGGADDADGDDPRTKNVENRAGDSKQLSEAIGKIDEIGAMI
jgi:hypothetical protein